MNTTDSTPRDGSGDERVADETTVDATEVTEQVTSQTPAAECDTVQHLPAGAPEDAGVEGSVDGPGEAAEGEGATAPDAGVRDATPEVSELADDVDGNADAPDLAVEHADAATPSTPVTIDATDPAIDVAASEQGTDVAADDDGDDLFAGLEPDARGMSRMLLDEQIALLIVDAGLLMPAADFIREVRAEAGFRVSPREISVATEQLVAGRRPLTVTTVAEIVAAGRGTRSERQQRHADDWRAFGALMLVRNLDGSPEGQREFVAQARRVAGVRGTDLLLLRTALAVGNMRQPLTPELVGQVAQALTRIWQDLSPDGFVQAAQRTARRIDRENRRPMRGGSVQMNPNVRRTKRKKRSQR